MEVISESQDQKRDAEIVRVANVSDIKEAAEHFGISVGRVRQIIKREKLAKIYPIVLTDGLTTMPIAEVRTSRGFVHACRCAMRKYSGTFSRLELPQWRLVSGADSIELGDEQLHA